MIDFTCNACAIPVYNPVATAPPADGLCIECRVIADAQPEDRVALARIFEKPAPVAIRRLMDEVRAGETNPQGSYERAHNRHNRS